jgi:hypothetical protein
MMKRNAVYSEIFIGDMDKFSVSHGPDHIHINVDTPNGVGRIFIQKKVLRKVLDKLEPFVPEQKLTLIPEDEETIQ